MHDCCNCGCACYCHGDIDDCQVETAEYSYMHCEGCGCEEDEDDHDDDYYEGGKMREILNDNFVWREIDGRFVPHRLTPAQYGQWSRFLKQRLRARRQVMRNIYSGNYRRAEYWQGVGDRMRDKQYVIVHGCTPEVSYN